MRSEKVFHELKEWEKGCRFFNVIGPGSEKLAFNEMI